MTSLVAQEAAHGRKATENDKKSRNAGCKVEGSGEPGTIGRGRENTARNVNGGEGGRDTTRTRVPLAARRGRNGTQ